MHTPNDDTSSVASSCPPAAPPSTSHDEILARLHAERAPRASSAFSPLPSDAASSAFTATSSSTHDELLARCHSDRSHRVRANTPKLMSSFDYDARYTDSDMADYTFLRASSEPIV